MSAPAVSHTGQMIRFHLSVTLSEPEPSAEGTATPHTRHGNSYRA